MSALQGSSRRGAVVVLLTLWQIVATGAHGLVWQTVRESAIDLRPLPRSLRLLTVAALLLIAGFLLSILFGDAVRLQSRLLPIQTESGSTRGLLVPAPVIPLTLLATTLAWSFLLAGALQVRWPIRWFVAGVYLIFHGLSLPLFLIQQTTLDVTLGVALAALGVLFVVLFAAPRRWLPLPGTWVLALFLHALPVLLAFGVTLQRTRLSAGYHASDLLTSQMDLTLVLITPFLFIAGLGWVDFAREVSGWLADAVQRHAPARLAAGLLGVFLAFRLWNLGRALASGYLGEQGGALAGAALFCLGLLALAAWRRGTAAGAVPGRLLVGLVLFSLLLQLLFFVGFLVASAVGGVYAVLSGDQTLFNRLVGLVSQASNSEPAFRPLLLALAGLVVAAIAGRRGRLTVATYGLILAWHRLLVWLTTPGRPLASLRFSHAEVDAVVLLALSALALGWFARRQLTTERAVTLLALALLMALLNQTDFLDNPFSPLFGFAGVFFLVFSVAWNALTAGAFANQDTPGFPRAGRLLLYLGYALLSVSVAHWFLVSHNLEIQITQADFNLNGFLIFGLPLAYLILVEGGRGLAEHEPSGRGEAEERS